MFLFGAGLPLLPGLLGGCLQTLSCISACLCPDDKSYACTNDAKDQRRHFPCHAVRWPTLRSIPWGLIPRCLQRFKGITMKSLISGNSIEYPVRLRRGSLLHKQDLSALRNFMGKQAQSKSDRRGILSLGLLSIYRTQSSSGRYGTASRRVFLVQLPAQRLREGKYFAYATSALQRVG